jgi:hypothetical protein
MDGNTRDATRWCCDAFRNRYDRGGDRSIAVLVDRNFAGEPRFLLQARAFEQGEEPQLDLPVAMSLVSEDAIVFCPWCGVPLQRFYGKDIDALIRPSLRIDRGDKKETSRVIEPARSSLPIPGPVREARFKFLTNSSGVPNTSQPDGNVHALFTIAGRSDASSCTASVIQQPNFAAAIANNNVIFRIPTPVFGSGLIENIDDSDLAYRASLGPINFGVNGTFNRAGDGTISRFGWKASVKSLETFSGNAYNIEMGVSNEVAPQERPSPNEDRAAGLPAACRVNPTPEDHTNFNTTAGHAQR